MSLTVNETSGFKSVDPGTYPARCIRLIDIGTQDTEFQGVKKSKKQVIVVWELPTELIQGGDYDGEPYIVSKFYTASLGDRANLRKDLEAWRGRAFTPEELAGFSLKNIIDKVCMLSIVHSDKGKAKVGGVMAMIKGMAVPERMNQLVCFDMQEWQAGDNSEYERLTDGIKEIINKSHEVKFGNEQQDKHDIPFDSSEIGEYEAF